MESDSFLASLPIASPTIATRSRNSSRGRTRIDRIDDMTLRYEISAETTFAASHQLRGYKADLEPLHGHNFRLEAFVSAEALDGLGVVMDFLELAAKLKEGVGPHHPPHI